LLQQAIQVYFARCGLGTDSSGAMNSSAMLGVCRPPPRSNEKRGKRRARDDARENDMGWVRP